MFLVPRRSRYDLQFRIFTIPVRIHPSFWLLCLLLSPMSAQEASVFYYPHNNWALLLLWISIAALTILIHELGHALAGLLLGQRSEIVLHTFGGLPLGSMAQPTFWKRLVVILPGPLLGLGMAWGFWRLYQPFWAQGEPGYFAASLFYFYYASMVWTLLNLVPVIPLDGGLICSDLMCMFSRRHGIRIALFISVVMAILLVAESVGKAMGRTLLPWVPIEGPLPAIIYFSLAWSNLSLLWQLRKQK